LTDQRLFTPRFFLMCGFSFSAFLAAFQLYPTAPFRILDLGGSEAVAGMFLGLMTYASAVSALFTGALADHFGKRRVMFVCALAAAAFSVSYAFIDSVPLMLTVAAVHGVFWSGMLSSVGAYLGDIIPSHRRAEGMGYYGVSTVIALAVAPAIGLWIYRFGWQPVCISAGAIDLAMAYIAYSLPATDRRRDAPISLRGAIEWRILFLSGTLFLYYFGYGGVTSFVALYATANKVTPPGIYFTVFAASAIATTLFAGPLGDRLGHTRVFVPSLALIAVAYAILAYGGTRFLLVTSGLIFGLAFRSAYQLYSAHVLHLVDAERRGAAFGSIISALDTGVGSGSIAMGWIIDHYGFGRAFGTAAVLAAMAVPYFLVANRMVMRTKKPLLVPGS
jgi:MFS family permease